MIFAVTGGRQFGCQKQFDGKLIVNMDERNYIYDVLDGIVGNDPFPILYHGDCPTGADRVAKAWAIRRGHEHKPFEAKWESYGKLAGPMRNQQMIDAKPVLLVAFPGGDGTADCVARAMLAGIPVFEARYETPDVSVCKERKPAELSRKRRRRINNDGRQTFDF